MIRDPEVVKAVGRVLESSTESTQSSPFARVAAPAEPVYKKPRLAVGRVDSAGSSESAQPRPFPYEALDCVLSRIDCHKDRNSVSLVSKGWYDAERWTRSRVFVGNCYAVSPEVVAARFPGVRAVVLKGKPRFSDFQMLPEDWGADFDPWLRVFATKYPWLEELRLKRMVISDESLEFLATNFEGFKALSLWNCEGFSTDGLKAIATHCKNLTELDIEFSAVGDHGSDWLGCFPENLTSLEVFNFSSLRSIVNYDALENLVARSKSLRVLKVNRNLNMNMLQRLLVQAPQLTELGTGTFAQSLSVDQPQEVERCFGNAKNLRILSGLWDSNSIYLRCIYPACALLTFLNLIHAAINNFQLAKIVGHCKSLRRLWVLDSVGDAGLQAVGRWLSLLEELRVFPAHPYRREQGVTDLGLSAVSRGCRKLRYVHYFCDRMTNDGLFILAKNCPDITHFRLYIIRGGIGYFSKQIMDEGFGVVVRSCTKLRRLEISAFITNRAFEYIGKYAKNLETLSVRYTVSGDLELKHLFRGCPKLRKLEIRGCRIRDEVLLSDLSKYESVRSVWMSRCEMTMNGCRELANAMPRLNVELMKEDWRSDYPQVLKLYVYRTLAGPRRDTPPSVLTL